MSKLKELVFVLAGILTAGIIASIVVACGPGQTDQSSLAQLALQPADLPDSDWRVTEATNADDMAQPLSRANAANLAPTESHIVTNYQAAYKAETLISDETFAAYAGNYLYRYNSPDEVERVAEILQNAFIREGGEALAAFTDEEQSKMTGQAFALRGSEGDAVYYFIGRQNDVLNVLMVNGAPTPETEAGFLSLVETLLDK